MRTSMWDAKHAISDLIRHSNYYSQYSVTYASESWQDSVDAFGNGIYEVVLSLISSPTHQGRRTFVYANNLIAFRKIIIERVVMWARWGILENNDFENDSCFQLIKKILLNCASSNDLKALYWETYNKIAIKIENSSLVSSSDLLIDAMTQADSLENFIGYFIELLEKIGLLSDFFTTFIDSMGNDFKSNLERFLKVASDDINISDYPDWAFRHYVSGDSGFLVQLMS